MPGYLLASSPLRESPPRVHDLRELVLEHSVSKTRRRAPPGLCGGTKISVRFAGKRPKAAGPLSATSASSG